MIVNYVRRASVVAVLFGTCVASGRAAQDPKSPDSSSKSVALSQLQGGWKRASDSDVLILRRNVAVQLQNRPLRQALDAVARSGGLTIAYGDEVVRSRTRVTLRTDRMPVLDALTVVLNGTDLEAFISVRGDALLIRSALPAVGQEVGSVVGRVNDAKTGAPLAGAEVFLEKTRWRTTTDTSGRYRLGDINVGSYILTVRRVGYVKKSRKVAVLKDAEDTANVALEAVAVRMNELIATGTGRQRRRDIGNAITSIRADSVLKTAPIRNLTDLLEDRVPGLTVRHTSGAPGDPARLRLRGLSSVLRSNDPIVILDGVRFYGNQSGARSGNLTNLDPAPTQALRANPIDVPAPSPLDQIDPNIIERIDVFKGPSAATMYGSDAANGVIVITTKRGKPGPTRWDASITRGRTDPPRQWPTGYYRWGRDLYIGSPRFCTLVDIRCREDSLVQFQALNDDALTILGRGDRTALSLTASGGVQAVRYNMTGTYTDETGLLTLPAFEVSRFRKLFRHDPPDWMRRPHNYKTWSIFNNITTILSPSMDVTLSSVLSRSEQVRSTLENQIAPMSGTYIDTLNGIYYRPNRVDQAESVAEGYTLNATTNVLQDYYVRQTSSTITFNTSLGASWRPRSWFTASGQAGLNLVPRSDRLTLPAALVEATDNGSVVQGTGRSLQSTFSLHGALRTSMGLGFMFTTNAGANVVSTTTNDLISSAAGLQPGTSSIVGAKRVDVTEAGSKLSTSTWFIEPGISGQRISLSTGLRLDGGSAYGVRLARSGNFGLPRLNASWAISEESWFPFGAIFSSFRVRGVYDQAKVYPGVVDRLRLYKGTADNPSSQLLLDKLGNTQLLPERSTEVEGGFDANFANNWIAAEVTFYRKLQEDAVMPLSLPASVNGGGVVLTNIGNIRNTGVELSLEVTPVQSSGLTWSARLNYSRNNNILTKLGTGVNPDKVQGLVEGFPVASRWARPILGFADQNDDGVLQPHEIQVGDSLVYMGRLDPAYVTSLSTDAKLFGGAVQVTARFHYDAGGMQIDRTARTNWVLARALVDPTTSLGDQAAVVVSTGGIKPTDYGLMQGISTFRFRSLSVNYRPPVRLARLIGAQEASIAIQGDNLALHSTYNGKDPDVSAWNPGESIADTGQLPESRTWQLAIFLKY